jgi:hypothetical protein
MMKRAIPAKVVRAHPLTASVTATIKPESAKPEIRMKPQTQNPKIGVDQLFWLLVLGIPSDFWFRISGFSLYSPPYGFGSWNCRAAQRWQEHHF